MQIWAETGKSALPIRNYSQILYQFLTFTQNLKRSPVTRRIIVPTYCSFTADKIRHLLHIIYLNVLFFTARFYLPY